MRTTLSRRGCWRRGAPSSDTIRSDRSGPGRNLREQFRGHAHFERTAEFCDLYDNPAFDAKAETLPMSEFEPMVRRVFAQPRNSIYKASTAVAATA